MDKSITLMVSTDEAAARARGAKLEARFDGMKVFYAADGLEALTKMRNAPPSVLITQLELPKVSGHELVRITARDPEFKHVGVIVLADIPDQSPLSDDLVRGKLKSLNEEASDEELFNAVSETLSRPALEGEATFRLRFYGPGDLVFREGEKAECAFLVKRGKLRAYRPGTKRVTLGTINAGEFVGEMAYIHHEPRSATVEALEASELIEIPLGTLDLLIYSKPAWAKALLKTLCRRLHDANQKKGLRI